MIAIPQTLPLWAVLSMLFVGAACGGSSETTLYNEPVTARVVVTDVQVSADDSKVESITVLTDDGEEITMIFGEEIEPAAWGPSHLLSHVGLGKTLGLKIEVTYIRGNESVTATNLSE